MVDTTTSATTDAGAGTATTTAASGTAATSTTSSPGILDSLTQWVERGFLLIVGLVIVAFGLWHLLGKPSIPQPPTGAPPA